MLTGKKVEGRRIRHLRIRRAVRGTAARPRLAVFRSLNHIYAQLIDDKAGRTLVAVDSRSPDFQQKLKAGGNVAAAKVVRSFQLHFRPARPDGRLDRSTLETLEALVAAAETVA